MTVADARAETNPLPIEVASFRVLTDSMPQMVWSTRPDGHHDYYNARWYEFTGVSPGSTDGEEWAGMFHPDDRPEAWKRWLHSLETGDPYEVEYRLRHHTGEYRWTIGRAAPIRDERGRIVRWIGTCTDINDSKAVAEENEILSRELSHRIKNIFSVLGGLISLSARQFPEAREFAKALRQRIAALGRANEFVRPHSEKSRPLIGRTTLIGLIQMLASPYPAFEGGRIRISGDDVPVDDRGATPVSLIFHELLTNSLKHGSLSTAEGLVEITLRAEDGSVHIAWVESGGPLVSAAPTELGFGTTLTEISAEGQLGGQLERFWKADGLTVRLRVPLARLYRASDA
ncbi:sensor histidine kinase [Aquibium oceanicum]|uniref:Blue-light-activated histidine kinase n=1 Tax=Aquibium oceanicum TaxID=1670800 RepID=A0A1L3SMR4_9HYPH|nr:PAS domain-containing protein [Aquibium oceanicum]APH70706.1 hypothetical protein BSQ44_04370 [Aquibium oceanicum]